MCHGPCGCQSLWRIMCVCVILSAKLANLLVCSERAGRGGWGGPPPVSARGDEAARAPEPVRLRSDWHGLRPRSRPRTRPGPPPSPSAQARHHGSCRYYDQATRPTAVPNEGVRGSKSDSDNTPNRPGVGDSEPPGSELDAGPVGLSGSAWGPGRSWGPCPSRGPTPAAVEARCVRPILPSSWRPCPSPVMAPLSESRPGQALALYSLECARTLLPHRHKGKACEPVYPEGSVSNCSEFRPRVGVCSERAKEIERERERERERETETERERERRRGSLGGRGGGCAHQEREEVVDSRVRPGRGRLPREPRQRLVRPAQPACRPEATGGGWGGRVSPPRRLRVSNSSAD